MEFWNTYDALLHYEKIISGSEKKIYPVEALRGKISKETEEYLLIGLKDLKDLYSQESKDFDEYFLRLINNSVIGKNIKNCISNVFDYLKDRKSISEFSSFDYLGLIYAERNMYFHNGEAAKMGISYKNRIKIIQLYKQILPKFILSSAKDLVELEIKQRVKS